MILTKNIGDVAMGESGGSFLPLLQAHGDHILRDTMMLVNPADTESGKISVGVTVIYPYCSTKGHSHADMEEVYYFISGSGKMTVGDDEVDVKAGDALYVPYGGAFHKTENTGNMPMQYLWVTNAR